MNETYNTGMDQNQISSAVNVGTTGTAYSTMYIARNGEDPLKIAESNENNGNIVSQVIGKASELRNSYLIIRTIIDLSNIDPSLWINQQQNLSIKYSLDGGFSGSQLYRVNNDDITASSTGKNIIVTKSIELT